MTHPAELRNTDLATLGDLLQMQRLTKKDLVLDASAIEMTDRGQLHIDGIDKPLDCTPIFDEGLADKLTMPLRYVRRMREHRPDLLAANVNGWLNGNPHLTTDEPSAYAIDDRKFLCRTFTHENSDLDSGGVARALLSDTYLRIDNFDSVFALLEGVEAAGVEAIVERAQLSERRMTIDLLCPQLGINVSGLLKDYRNPFPNDPERAGGWTVDRARKAAMSEHLGYDAGDEPIMWAGIRATNSETGNGKFSLVPIVKFKICRNGLVLTEHVVARTHLGERLDAGVYSDETQAKSLELVKLMTRDNVKNWLSMDFLHGIADQLAHAEKPIEDAARSVEILAQRQSYSDETAAGILNHFIKGGQMSVLGLMQAVTSYAQVVESPDEAYQLENNAFGVLAGAYA